MITPEAVQFIKDQLVKGVPEVTIRGQLTSGGWQLADLDEAFRVARPPTPVASTSPAMPPSTPSHISEHKKSKLFVLIPLTIGIIVIAAVVWAYRSGYFSRTTNQDVSENSITISDQIPGDKVIVGNIKILHGGFILIGADGYDDSGTIGISRYLEPNEYNNLEIILQYPMDETVTTIFDGELGTFPIYHATLIKDDGDKLYDESKDQLVTDSQDVIVSSMFYAKGDLPPQSDDAIKKKLVSFATAAAPQFYQSNQSSYMNFCDLLYASGDGDHTENIFGFSCQSSQDSFRISEKLSNENYFCVDSLGFMGSLSAMRGPTCQIN